jgi:hypothetical protein
MFSRRREEKIDSAKDGLGLLLERLGVLLERRIGRLLE